MNRCGIDAYGLQRRIGATTRRHVMATEEAHRRSQSIEHTGRRWMVVSVVEGERRQFKPAHPDLESAAGTHREASDRWTGAAAHVSPNERPGNQKTQEPKPGRPPANVPTGGREPGHERRAGRLRIDPVIVTCTSETETPELRTAITDGFGSTDERVRVHRRPGRGECARR
jgi:hypothetical protein